MTRLLATFVVLGLFTGVSLGEEPNELAQDWIKYFDGKWTRESKVWTQEDGWKEETVDWQGELVSGGLTLFSRGKSDWGAFSTAMGIDGFTRDFFEYGSAANGNRWRVTFDVIEKGRIKGELLAGVKDGRKGKGQVEIKRIDDDKYRASWSLEYESGGTMKGEATNTRR